jgi:ABC-type molybdate transport system substrate-binding protein
MRAISLSFALLLLSSAAPQAAEIRVMSPGVIANSGLRELAAAYTKKTGIVVTVVPEGMGQIVKEFKTSVPAADIVMLPMDLMGTLALERGIKPGSFTALGRVEIGLFKKQDAPLADISTVEKLAGVMKQASAVMYTDPASGSMQAGMSEQLLKRPEFAGVKGLPVQGDAEPALRRGQGDDKALGLGLIHGPHGAGQATGNPFLVGRLPAELGAHMDMATAISVRSDHVKEAEDFVAYMLGAESGPVWASKGTDRY